MVKVDNIPVNGNPGPAPESQTALLRPLTYAGRKQLPPMPAGVFLKTGLQLLDKFHAIDFTTLSCELKRASLTSIPTADANRGHQRSVSGMVRGHPTTIGTRIKRPGHRIDTSRRKSGELSASRWPSSIASGTPGRSRLAPYILAAKKEVSTPALAGGLAVNQCSYHTKASSTAACMAPAPVYTGGSPAAEELAWRRRRSRKLVNGWLIPVGTTGP